MDLDSNIKKLDKFLDSDEGKDFIARWQEKERVAEENSARRARSLHDWLKSMSPDGIQSVLDRFIEWEVAYEEYEYTVNHTQTVSNLFGLVCAMFESYGWKLDMDTLDQSETMFLGSVTNYGEFQLREYHGQGCFHRLYRNGNEIFTTT